MTVDPSSLWFTQFKPGPQASSRLFCFPYAGGGADIFRRWALNLSPAIEVCAVQLPGRGRRINEPPCTRLLTMVNEIDIPIRAYLDKPFFFFGHSMGAIIAFELARRLRREVGLGPSRLLVSGCRAPQLPNTDPKRHQLPDREFLEELEHLNGTPKEVLAHPEMVQYLLPTLRGDFEAIEKYVYSPAPPLTCPISAFGGTDDPEVKAEQLEAWRDQTTSGFTLRMFSGNHFFIHDAEELLLRVVGLVLANTDLGPAR
jgi:medium-chain acyl-[acyl-carrier-protein] hydrolase